MTAAELMRALKERNIPPLLFLFGEEDFFLEKTMRRLIDQVVPPEARDFNLTVCQGREVGAETILDSARTLPVFAPNRLVVVRNAEQIPATELDFLLPYLKDPAPETVLLFTAEKIDRRKKFFQEFKKLGELVEFKSLYENQIPAFVRNQAQEAGHRFTEDALELFCKRVGTNLREIDAELTKLFSYVGDRNLADVEDVAAVVSDTRVDSVFDLTNALGKRDAAGALRLLGRLLDEGSAPLLVLNMMVRHFRQLWKTSEYIAQGVAKKELPRLVGVNPYFLDGLMAQSRRFSPQQYRGAFELFLEADLALKSSGAHPAALLETLIVKLIGSGEQGRGEKV